MPITTEPTCEACGQPIDAAPAVRIPAPGGGTWHLHCDVRDCVRALTATRRAGRRADDRMFWGVTIARTA